jgi:hypothetical protein
MKKMKIQREVTLKLMTKTMLLLRRERKGGRSGKESYQRARGESWVNEPEDY